MADIIYGTSPSPVTITINGVSKSYPAGTYNHNITQADLDALPSDQIYITVANNAEIREFGPFKKVAAPTSGVIPDVQFSPILNGFVSAAEAVAGVTIGAPGGPANSNLILSRVNDDAVIANITSNASGVWSYTLTGTEITATPISGNRAVTYKIYDPVGDSEATQTIEYHNYIPKVTVTQSGWSTDSTGAVVSVSSDALSFPSPEETEVYVRILNGSGTQQTEELKLFTANNAGGDFNISNTIAQAAATAGNYIIDGYVMNRRYKNKSSFNIPVQVSSPAGGTPPATGDYSPYPPTTAVASTWTLPAQGQTTTVSGRTVRYISPERPKYSKINSFAGDTHILSHQNGNLYTLAGALVGATGYGSSAVASWITGGRVYGLRGTSLYQKDAGQSEVLLYNFANSGAVGNLEFGANEGGPSVDDNTFVVTQGDPVQKAYVWKRGTGVIGTLTAAQIQSAAGLPGESVDSVTVSPLGNYLLAHINTGNRALVRYNVNCTGPVLVGTRKNNGVQRLKAEHGTFVIMPDGSQARVQAHWGGISVFNLEDPTVIYDMSVGFGHGHYSGGAYLRRGYVVMSVANGNSDVIGIPLDWSMWNGATESNKDVGGLGYSLGATTVPSTEKWVNANYNSTAYPGPSPTVNRYGNKVVFSRNTGGENYRMCLVYQT